MRDTLQPYLVSPVPSFAPRVVYDLTSSTAGFLKKSWRLWFPSRVPPKLYVRTATGIRITYLWSRLRADNSYESDKQSVWTKQLEKYLFGTPQRTSVRIFIWLQVLTINWCQINTNLLNLNYDGLEAPNISPDSTLLRLVVDINGASKHIFGISVVKQNVKRKFI